MFVAIIAGFSVATKAKGAAIPAELTIARFVAGVAGISVDTDVGSARQTAPAMAVITTGLALDPKLASLWPANQAGCTIIKSSARIAPAAVKTMECDADWSRLVAVARILA